MHYFTLLQAIFLILLLPPKPQPHPAEPQNSGINPDSEYVILVPVGDSTDGFPILTPISSSDPRVPIARQLFETTFIREMIPIQDSIREILNSEGELTVKEPLYLLLSGKMGGFPRMGFYLKQEEEVLDKTRVPYVDLADMDENYARLSSITQIFPHELAHIFYRQLTNRDPEQVDSYSSDIHYFSIVTDYDKAFNEGYAESYENLARLHEPNIIVKEGIDADTRRLEEYLPPNVRGFERDFHWPLRIGYYRMTMVTWFQQLEDYKRYIWAVEGKAKYPSSVGSHQSPVTGHQSLLPCFADPASRIALRNSCVTYDSTKLLSPAQAASTEGVICSFFTNLRGSDPAKICLPKEFIVIHKYLRDLPTGISPLHVFIDGYMLEFPDERERVLKAWKQASGRNYMAGLIPEIWILNSDYNHDFWVMAQFGGATLPFYTMNLNTARSEDLMTLPGISEEDAGKIIACRDSVGWFKTIDEMMAVPGISQEKASLVIRNRLVPEELDAMEYEGEIGLWGLIFGTLKRLLMASAAITLVISIILYFLFYFRKKSFKDALLMIFRTLFKSLLFISVGLIVLIFPFPSWMLFGTFVLVVLLINFWRTRKKLSRRRELITSSILISLMVLYSLF